MSDLEINMSSSSPSNFLVFGAAGHIGGPAAQHLAARRPGALIRLVTSRADQADALRTEHPTAEVRVANYLDAADMRTVFDGIEAAFVVTPDFLDEATAMGNIVDAVETPDDFLLPLLPMVFVDEVVEHFLHLHGEIHGFVHALADGGPVTVAGADDVAD